MRNAKTPDEQLPVVDESEVQVPKTTPAQMAKVLNIAREQLRLKKKAEDADEAAKKAKETYRKNVEDELPKAMVEANLAGKIPLGDRGATVELDTVTKASIPNANNKKIENAELRNATGIAMMDKRAPDMVDTVLTIRFPKGTEKELARFLGDNKRRKKPLEMELNRTVHTGALVAWIERELAAGRDFTAAEREALGFYQFKIAEVKLPKAKKTTVV